MTSLPKPLHLLWCWALSSYLISINCLSVQVNPTILWTQNPGIVVANIVHYANAIRSGPNIIKLLQHPHYPAQTLYDNSCQAFMTKDRYHHIVAAIKITQDLSLAQHLLSPECLKNANLNPALLEYADHDYLARPTCSWAMEMSEEALAESLILSTTRFLTSIGPLCFGWFEATSSSPIPRLQLENKRRLLAQAITNWEFVPECVENIGPLTRRVLQLIVILKSYIGNEQAQHQADHKEVKSTIVNQLQYISQGLSLAYSHVKSCQILHSLIVEALHELVETKTIQLDPKKLGERPPILRFLDLYDLLLLDLVESGTGPRQTPNPLDPPVSEAERNHWMLMLLYYQANRVFSLSRVYRDILTSIFHSNNPDCLWPGDWTFWLLAIDLQSGNNLDATSNILVFPTSRNPVLQSTLLLLIHQRVQQNSAKLSPFLQQLAHSIPLSTRLAFMRQKYGIVYTRASAHSFGWNTASASEIALVGSNCMSLEDQLTQVEECSVPLSQIVDKAYLEFPTLTTYTSSIWSHASGSREFWRISLLTIMELNRFGALLASALLLGLQLSKPLDPLQLALLVGSKHAFHNEYSLVPDYFATHSPLTPEDYAFHQPTHAAPPENLALLVQRVMAFQKRLMKLNPLVVILKFREFYSVLFGVKVDHLKK